MQKIVALALASLFLFHLAPVARASAPRATQDGASTQEIPLTNKDVYAMVKAKIAPEVIVAKIESSRCHFETAPNVLAEMRYQGIPDAVLMAMIKAPYGSPQPAPKTKAGRAVAESAPTDIVEVVIPDGTPVEVETAYTVNSGDVEEGSAISFRVVRPVKVGDHVVIKAGASATARVTKAKKGGSWGRAGSLVWEMSDITALDSSRVPARFTKATKGDSKGGTVTTAVVVTSLLFWPAAPFWGFKKGKNAKVPAGKRFEVFTHGDATVKVGVPAE
jgi:hypothetical protein